MNQADIKKALKMIKEANSNHNLSLGEDWAEIISVGIIGVLDKHGLKSPLNANVDNLISDIRNMINVGSKYKKSGLKHVLIGDVDEIESFRDFDEGKQ